MVSLSIRRTEDLDTNFAEILDPFGVVSFGWVHSFRKLFTFSREVDKLSFYDIPSGRVSVVRELKVGSREVPFSSDFSLCAVVAVNKSNKEYVQLISVADFTMLTSFEIKSRNCEAILFTQGDHCLLVCERHYSNTLYLYSITGLLISELSLQATFSMVRPSGDKLFVADDEANLMLLDDVCLNVLMSKNVLKMAEDLSGATRVQEYIDERPTDIHKKKRSSLTRLPDHQAGEKDRAQAGQGRAVWTEDGAAVDQLCRDCLRWDYKLVCPRCCSFLTGRVAKFANIWCFWNRFPRWSGAPESR